MNETEAVIALAIGGEPAADDLDGPAEQFCLLRIDAHSVAPAAPVRASPRRGSFRNPSCAAGTRPGVATGARAGACGPSDSPSSSKGWRKSCPMPGSDPGLPIGQHDIARVGHGRMRDDLDDLAVAPAHRAWRGHDAAVAQIDQPGEFRGNGGPGVIAVAMDAQRPAAAVRRLNAIGRILREIDHLDGQSVRQIVVAGGRARQLEQDAQLLLMGQMIEIRHDRARYPSRPSIDASTRSISARPSLTFSVVPDM